MPIAMYMIFVVVGVFAASLLGEYLSASEKRSVLQAADAGDLTRYTEEEG